jgi:hypothetical protein
LLGEGGTEAESFPCDRADVLRDLGLLNAQLVSVRFVNDIVYW